MPVCGNGTLGPRRGARRAGGRKPVPGGAGRKRVVHPRRRANKKPAVWRVFAATDARARRATGGIQAAWMFEACFPLGPWVTSKLTF
jgi:hypothetical protein